MVGTFVSTIILSPHSHEPGVFLWDHFLFFFSFFGIQDFAKFAQPNKPMMLGSANKQKYKNIVR